VFLFLFSLLGGGQTVNLSSSLKTLATKQYQLTEKQRLMVIATIVVMAIFITIYMSYSEVAVEPTLPSNNPQQIAITSIKPVIPIGSQVTQVSQANQAMRDPFASPPDIKEQQSKTDPIMPAIPNHVPNYAPNNVPAMVPKQVGASKPQESFKLTGLVGNTERRLAVIMSANKSQSYSVNDMIGTYKIVTINDDSVILTNATGNVVLRLEAAGQKGG